MNSGQWFKREFCWNSYVDLWYILFGDYRAPDYKKKSGKMKLTYQKNCVRMSLKTHYLFDHLDIFQTSRGYNE